MSAEPDERHETPIEDLMPKRMRRMDLSERAGMILGWLVLAVLIGSMVAVTALIWALAVLAWRWVA